MGSDGTVGGVPPRSRIPALSGNGGEGARRSARHRGGSRCVCVCGEGATQEGGGRGVRSGGGKALLARLRVDEVARGRPELRAEVRRTSPLEFVNPELKAPSVRAGNQKHRTPASARCRNPCAMRMCT